MSGGKKRILVVAHDQAVRETRAHLLQAGGYSVESAVTDDQAMERLETETFDLVLLGRSSLMTRFAMDQRLRERYPDLLTLKIETDVNEPQYASRVITDYRPARLLELLREMLDSE